MQNQKRRNRRNRGFRPIVLTYDHAEARGTVRIEDGAYGPIFTVLAPDGTTYTGFIDLHHFSPSSGRNCLQLILDRPEDGQNPAETFHVRQYADGRVETFE